MSSVHSVRSRVGQPSYAKPHRKMFANLGRSRSTWAVAASKLAKRGLTASRAAIRTALESTGFQADAAMELLVKENKVTKVNSNQFSGAFDTNRSKHDRPGEEDSVAKKTRSNENIANTEVEALLSGQPRAIRDALLLATADNRVSNWTARVSELLVPAETAKDGSGLSSDDFNDFLFKLGGALDNISETRVKVTLTLPVFTMLADAHSMDSDLDKRVASMESVCSSLDDSSFNTQQVDQFVPNFSKYTDILNCVFTFLTYLITKLERLQFKGTEVAEKFRITLSKNMMKQSKEVLLAKKQVDGVKKRVRELEEKILHDVQDNSSKFEPGDLVLAKVKLPNVPQEVFVPAEVCAVDPNLLRIQVKFQGASGVQSAQWIRSEDVQVREGSAGQTRLHSTLLDKMQDPRKQLLLQKKRETQKSLAECEQKLSSAQVCVFTASWSAIIWSHHKIFVPFQ